MAMPTRRVRNCLQWENDKCSACIEREKVNGTNHVQEEWLTRFANVSQQNIQLPYLVEKILQIEIIKQNMEKEKNTVVVSDNITDGYNQINQHPRPESPEISR
jgi:hypothetical protein